MFFSKFDVNRIEWLNLVFENRNQSYGAYELRLKSSRYLRNALLWSALGLTTAIVAPSVVHLLKGDAAPVAVNAYDTPDEKDNDNLVRLIDVELQPVKPAEAPAAKSAPASKTDFKQIKYTTPTVSHSGDAELPPTEALKTATISHINQDGPEKIDLNLLPGTANGKGNGSGTGLTEGAGEGNGGDPFIYVEVMPEFPGGMNAWGRYLQKNLRYPVLAVESRVVGKVIVSFVVEKDGKLTDVKIVRGIGAGCDQEAIRVIKSSPLWKPGLQNGKPVRVAYTIPIVFQLN